MTRLFRALLVAALIAWGLPVRLEAAASSVSFGQTFKSIDTATSAVVVTGTAIELPVICRTSGCIVKAVVTFTGSPSAFSAELQGASEDVDSEYRTVFTLTSATTETMYISGQNGRFVRAKQTSRTGGTDTTVTLTVSPPEVGGSIRNDRFRVAIADVNAGKTILPARAGIKYRLIDGYMIPVGGAVITCTAVVVLGTQAAGSATLLSAAVAALTQSAKVGPGYTNVANVSGLASILADGASFVANDVNTAVTVGKTGGTCATATNVDFVLSYAIETP